MLRLVLASMLVTRETDLEIALSQKVEIQTSAIPANPPNVTSEQTNNSVVIRIQAFDASQVGLRECSVDNSNIIISGEASPTI